MQKSESIALLAHAVVQAQKDMGVAVFDSEGHFDNKYASLGQFIKAAKPTLHKNGLAVLQFGEQVRPDEFGMSTMLLHASGEFICGTMAFPIVDHSPQKIASLITYARRYGLASMLAMVSDKDDDGHAASQAAPVVNEMKSADILENYKQKTDAAESLEDIEDFKGPLSYDWPAMTTKHQGELTAYVNAKKEKLNG